MLKGLDKKFCSNVSLTQELEVLSKLIKGHNKFPSFKRGMCEKFYPVLIGGGGGEQNVSDPRFPIL